MRGGGDRVADDGAAGAGVLAGGACAAGFAAAGAAGAAPGINISALQRGQFALRPAALSGARRLLPQALHTTRIGIASPFDQWMLSHAGTRAMTNSAARFYFTMPLTGAARVPIMRASRPGNTA